MSRNQADPRTRDPLRPFLHRLQRLAGGGADTGIALGSDAIDAASKELSSRWAKARRNPEPPMA